jgi:tripartite-type tricarboxylate transporter receptor subunit TctC
MRFLTALVALGLIASAPAQAAFPEKDIEIVIPYGPGGGFDTLTRKLAPYIEEYFAKKQGKNFNNIKVVPKNMPGASGKKAAVYTSKQKPDGHTIQIFNIPGHGLPYIKGEDAGYDITGFTWLNRVGGDDYVVIVAKDSPYKTFKDLLNKSGDLKIPEQGPGSTSNMANKITWATFNKGGEYIYGYKSSRDYSTAVLRGDGDVTMLASGSAKRYNKAGDFRIVAHWADEVDPAFEGAVNGNDVGHPELHDLGLLRMMAGPAGMSPEVTKTWTEALAYAVNHPDIQAWSAKTGNPVLAYDSAEKTKEVLMKNLGYFKKFSNLFTGK